jgi:hypothetical protein
MSQNTSFLPGELKKRSHSVFIDKKSELFRGSLDSGRMCESPALEVRRAEKFENDPHRADIVYIALLYVFDKT